MSEQLSGGAAAIVVVRTRWVGQCARLITWAYCCLCVDSQIVTDAPFAVQPKASATALLHPLAGGSGGGGGGEVALAATTDLGTTRPGGGTTGAARPVAATSWYVMRALQRLRCCAPRELRWGECVVCAVVADRSSVDSVGLAALARLVIASVRPSRL